MPAAKKTTKTPARRTGRAPAKRRTTTRRSTAKNLLSEAFKLLPYFVFRYLRDLGTKQKFLPWPDITIPLLIWFINTKKELMTGAKDAALFLLGEGIYTRVMGAPAKPGGALPDMHPRNVDALIASTKLTAPSYGAVDEGGVVVPEYEIY